MRSYIRNPQKRPHWRGGARVLSVTAALLLATQLGATAQVTGQLGTEIPLGRRVPASAPGYQWSPTLAQGPSSYLTVWAESDVDGGSEYSIVARRLQSEGRPLTEPALLVAKGEQARNPDVAYGAGRYLVAFLDGLKAAGQVKVARVSENGNLLDPQPVPLAPDRVVEDPQVVWLGDAFVVSWSQTDASHRTTQHAVLVDEAGLLLTPTPIKLIDGHATDLVAGPDGELLVLGEGQAQRFDSALQPMGTPVRVGEGEGLHSGAFDGERYLIAWSDNRNFPEDQVRAAALTLDGVLGDSHVVGTHDYFMEKIRVVHEGPRFGVVWNVLHDPVIYARRVSPDGTVLDAAAITLYDAPGPSGVSGFDAAASPEGIVAVADADTGQTSDNIVSAWLGPTAAAARSPRLVSRAANGQRMPAFASGDNVGLVVWQDWRKTYWENNFHSRTWEKPTDLYFARLRRGKLVPSGGRRLSSGSQGEYDTDIAWTGRRFLVAWVDHDRRDIFLRHVTASGDVGAKNVVAGPSTVDASPRIAGIAGRAYLVWSNTSGGYPDTEQIFGRLVNRRGRLGPRKLLWDGFSDGFDVTSVGRRFAVVWSGSGSDDRLRLRTIDLRGNFASRTRTIARPPTAAFVRLANGSGRLLVTWLEPEADTSTARVMRAVVHRDGHLIGTIEPIAEGALGPAEIIWDGEHFVVSLMRKTGEESQGLQVLKLNSAGRVVARESQELGRISWGYARRPALAELGGQANVVYERHAPEAIYGGVNRIFLRRVR